MKIKDFDLEDYVFSLNAEYADNVHAVTGNYPDDYPYSYTSNGYAFSVDFMGTNVFCSENDRTYDENDNVVIIPTIMKNVTRVMTDIYTHSKSETFENFKWKEDPFGGK